MKSKLSSLGMVKGRQYESIITTNNEKNQKNAAPIGIICSGEDKILCRIFKGSTTLNNILDQKKFTVNITHDAELFTLSTFGNLPEDYFNEDNSIRNADAYFKCKVIGFSDAVKKSDPIRKSGHAVVIKSEVTDIVINKAIRAVNRGFGYVIETLVNFSRFDISDDYQKEEYIERFKECYRVVSKVGYSEEKEAMMEIKKILVRKGYEI